MLAPFNTPPTIVGTVRTIQDLRTLEASSLSCDVVEARLDLIGWDEPWLEACQSLETAGMPVLATLRLEAEGGQWTGRDTNRLGHLLTAIDELAAIDVELQSDLVPVLAERAASQNKPIVLSFHDFERVPEPAALEDTIAAMTEYPNAIAKLAVRAQNEADVERLAELLAAHRERAPSPTPLCLIAMGDTWAHTRVSFPAAGSALTYAFLGDTPSAPGQLSCTDVRKALRP